MGTKINEKVLLLILAAVQFTHILDFMIVMPLGPQFIRVFGISTAEFGFLISVYTFSAGISGLSVALFIDRFDRKRVLLFSYAGFTVGTLLCALAPTYAFLVAARLLAGAFGGVTSSMTLAIVGDVIPVARRGSAMGKIMAAFSLASIAGIPIGLFLANRWDWHAPFFMLVGLGVFIGLVGWYFLPSLRSHLVPGEERRNAFREMQSLLSHPNHLRALSLTVLMTFSGFMVIPYISPYLVANSGLTEAQLPFIYLIGGFCTFFSMPLFGKLGDRFGLLRVFTIMSLLTIVPIAVLTNLPVVPLGAALAVTTLFMVISSGRMVPGMAMVTSSPASRVRGSFMSVNSAAQQFSTSLAAFTAGLVLHQTASGEFSGYPRVGLLSMLFLILSVVVARGLRFQR